MLTCGLVVLNYKDYETTIELLNNIKDFREIDYIAVVDNMSPNNSYEILKAYENEKIHVMKSDRNGGYSYGNNYGARYLIEKFHPDIIGIANPDVIFGEDLVKRVKEVFAERDEYAVLTGIQHNVSGEAVVNFHNDESTPLAFLKPLMYENFMRPLHIMKPKKEKIMLEKIISNSEAVNQVWEVEGCLFFIRTSDFVNIGMFDDNVFLYYEEHILAFKLQKLGRKTGIINDVTYIHAHAVNPDRIEQLESGMRFIRNSTASRKYYFNNYVTKNKLLHGIHNFLLWFRWLKSYAGYSFQKIMIQFIK